MDNIVKMVHFVLQVYSSLIIGHIIISWIPQLRDSIMGKFLDRTVKPFLSPFKQLIPTVGIVDISPIVALVSLHLAEKGFFYLISILISKVGV